MKQILKRAAAFGSALALSLSSLAILAVPSVHAAACTWTNSSGDEDFNNVANWSGCSGAAPGATDDVTIDPTLNNSTPSFMPINISADITVHSITITGDFSSQQGFTLSASANKTLTIASGGSITNTATGGGADPTITAPIAFAGDGTITNTANTSALMIFSGTVDVAGASTLTVSSALGAIDNRVEFGGAITGAGSINVSAGRVDYKAANTYAGLTTVGGYLFLNSATATLGSTATKTVVSSGGTLEFAAAAPAPTGEDFDLAGVGNAGGSITTAASAVITNKTLSMNTVTLTAATTVCAVGPSVTLTLYGDATTGAVDVATNALTKSADTGCTGASKNATSSLGVFSGTPTPTPTPADCTSPITLASGSVGGTECAQVAQGATYTGDVSIASGGVLIVDGTLTGNATVNGTLKGSGTVTGAVTVSATGVVAPGNSPGILNTGNLSFVSGSSLDVEIGGTTAGQNPAGYDQVNVTGTVDVTGATLNVSAFNNFTPAVGDQFTIINNDAADAVTGTFNGLAEGATLTVGGVTYSISYKGTDASTGNDVVLTVTAVTAQQGGGQGGTTTPTNTPATPNTGFAALMTNPATIMFSTTAVAGAILAIARKYNLLKG